MAFLRSWLGVLARSRWGGLVLVGIGVVAIAVSVHTIESAWRAAGRAAPDDDAPPEPIVPEIRKIDELTVAIVLDDTVTRTRMKLEAETELYHGCVVEELEALLAERPEPDADGEDAPPWLQRVREKDRLAAGIGRVQRRCIAVVRADREARREQAASGG